MSHITDKHDEESINRRAYLAALSAGAGAGLAGCLGGDGEDDGGGRGNGADDGDDDTEHGERVPTVTIAWFQGASGGDAVPVLQQVLEDDFGVPVEVEAKEFITAFEEMYNDARTWDYIFDLNPPTPENLDPMGVFENHLLCDAGDNGRANTTQYASCEFTELYHEQARTSGDERRSLVQQADQVYSEDVAHINLFPMVSRGAYREDMIEILDLGSRGITNTNPDLWWETRAVGEADRRVAAVASHNIATSHYMTHLVPELWVPCVFMPLNYYDGELELTSGLATDWEISDDLHTYTFTLREGATFHNGDPVTVEDVKWTFEYVSEHAAEFPQAAEIEYESIDAVDDHTIEFNLAEPRPNFHTINTPRWGIVPKDLWIDGGAEDNPAEFEPDPIVGSGPLQVTEFEKRSVVFMEPYEDHWIDAGGEFVHQAFEGEEPAQRAFAEGTVQILFGEYATVQTLSAIEDTVPEGETRVAPGWTTHMLSPQLTVPPVMFREFNLAVSHAIDRTRMNTLMENGASEPQLYASTFAPDHPFYPEDHEGLTQIAESPEGDVERGREILEDAGYTWDDDGRLRFPPDKDLSPPWPEGSQPSDHPDEFPCTEELCE